MVEGAMRPPFLTPTGQPIFPEDEEDKWWLTELQRAPGEEKGGDEDGPPTDNEAAEEDDDVIDPEEPIEDEDPLSESGEEIPASGGLPVEAPHTDHNPLVYWRR